MPWKKITITKRDKLLLIILFTLFYFFFIWHLSDRPDINDPRQTYKELAGLKHEYKTLLEVIDEASALENTWLAVFESPEGPEYTLLDLTALPEVLNNLEGFLTEKPVSVNSLRVNETVYYENHASTTLHLNASAAPYHLQELIEQLEEMPYLIYFDYLNWDNHTKNNAEIELQLQLIFFIDRTQTGI